MPCQYFRSSDKPTAAQITAVDNGGMFMVRVTPSEGQPFTQRFVFHVDDIRLNDRPADWRANYGVWDYLPGYPRFEEVQKEEPAPASETEPAKEEPPLLAKQVQQQPQQQRQQPTGPLQRSGKQ